MEGLGKLKERDNVEDRDVNARSGRLKERTTLKT
jgi:hypothetical protein